MMNRGRQWCLSSQINVMTSALSFHNRRSPVVPFLLASLSFLSSTVRVRSASTKSGGMGVIYHARTSSPMKAEIQRKLKAAQVFCLDVDSTVVTVEGIDELAELAGVADAVKKLTTAAMEGGMTYHSALRQRLQIIKPNLSLIAKFLSLNPPTQQLSPNVRELIKLLHDRGAVVYLVSGGFKELIAPVAAALDIPLDNVYANSLRWTIDGQFSSFDPQSWTAVAGGKKRALEHIRHLHAADATASSKVSGVSNEKHDMGVILVMIGDGATDLEARDAQDGAGGADVFVGYGGSKERKAVREAADLYIHDFQQLIHLLN